MPYHDVATLAAHAAVVPLATDDPARWTRNTSAHTWTCSYDRVEKAIRFDAAWKPDASDRWMYPKYTLDPSRENMAGAVEVTYEVKIEQDKAENDVDHCNAMLAYAPGKGRTMLFLPQKPPSGTWERRSFVVPVHSPDGGPASVDVQGIQFGCGPRGTRLTYWLRNVRVLRSPRALVDYAPYFTDEVYAQTNGCRRANLEPMLDAETLVPNGGICRFMPNEGWKKGNTPRLARVFGESPYQTSAPMLYDRPNWYELERARGEWLFDRRLEPLFKRCLAERRTGARRGGSCVGGRRRVPRDQGRQGDRAASLPLQLRPPARRFVSARRALCGRARPGRRLSRPPAEGACGRLVALDGAPCDARRDSEGS